VTVPDVELIIVPVDVEAVMGNSVLDDGNVVFCTVSVPLNTSFFVAQSNALSNRATPAGLRLSKYCAPKNTLFPAPGNVTSSSAIRIIAWFDSSS